LEGRDDRKATEKQRTYTKQFKIDAVKIVTGQGYNISEAARNPDIHQCPLACTAPAVMSVRSS
jgi:transposase-like protein